MTIFVFRPQHIRHALETHPQGPRRWLSAPSALVVATLDLQTRRATLISIENERVDAHEDHGRDDGRNAHEVVAGAGGGCCGPPRAQPKRKAAHGSKSKSTNLLEA